MGYTYIYIISRKMRGSFLRASATYCIGIAERSGTAQPDAYLKVVLGKGFSYALMQTIEK